MQLYKTQEFLENTAARLKQISDELFVANGVSKVHYLSAKLPKEISSRGLQPKGLSNYSVVAMVEPNYFPFRKATEIGHMYGDVWEIDYAEGDALLKTFIRKSGIGMLSDSPEGIRSAAEELAKKAEVDYGLMSKMISALNPIDRIEQHGSVESSEAFGAFNGLIAVGAQYAREKGIKELKGIEISLEKGKGGLSNHITVYTTFDYFPFEDGNLVYTDRIAGLGDGHVVRAVSGDVFVNSSVPAGRLDLLNKLPSALKKSLEINSPH